MMDSCKNCQLLGMRMYADWMLPDERWHQCRNAQKIIGLVEQNFEPCSDFKKKETK